jgi:hypothetical protein
MDIYYKKIFDLITSISLICKKNYTTDINNTISLPKNKTKKKRLTKVERSKININSNESLNEIIIGLLLGDGHIQSRQLNGNCRFMYGQSSLRKTT